MGVGPGGLRYHHFKRPVCKRMGDRERQRVAKALAHYTHRYIVRDRQETARDRLGDTALKRLNKQEFKSFLVQIITLTSLSVLAAFSSCVS